MNKRAVLGTMALLLTKSVWSDTSPQSDDGVDCSHPMGEQEEVMCVAIEYKKADAQLNRIYKELKERSSAAERKALTLDERDWIKQRDSLCRQSVESDEGDDDSGPDIGTGHLRESGQTHSCLLEETQNRIQTLEDKLKALQSHPASNQ